MRRRAAVWLALLLVPPGAASAEAPRTSSLSLARLAGAEGCIGARALAEAVEKRLGRPVFAPASQADLSVEGHIRRQGRGFVAVLAVSTSSGQILGRRELSTADPSCRELDDQIALVVALLIDPEAALAPPPPSASAPAPPPASAPQPPPSAPPQAPAAASSAMTPPPSVADVAPAVASSATAPPPSVAAIAPLRWNIAAAVGAEAALGLLPGAALGVSAGVRVEPQPWLSFGVEGSLWQESEVHKDGGVVRFRLALAGFSACPLVLSDRQRRAAVCARVELGSLRLQSEGFDVNDQQETLASGVSVLGRFVQRLRGPLVAQAGAALMGPLSRDRFFVRGNGGVTSEVFRMAPVVARVELGLGVDFW